MTFSKKLLATVLISAGLLLIIGLVGFRHFRSQQADAGLKVESTPLSQVFVNNQLVGKTPLEKTFPPGELSVKIIPDATSPAVSSYETKVTLVSGVFTVIKRDLGPTDSATAGEVVTLIPDLPSKSSLSMVTSLPISASISVDDQPQGFTPLNLTDISPGDHKIVVSSPGFSSRVIFAKSILGYKLAINVKLKESPSSKPSIVLEPDESPKASPSAILISDTPTGFLRVRSGPGKSYSEVGQVKPGEKYPLVSEVQDWYQIQISFSATTSGWISSQYTTKLN